MSENFEKTTIDRLARIEEGINQLLKSGNDHETRLRSLEVFRWLVVGCLLAIGGGFGRMAGVI